MLRVLDKKALKDKGIDYSNPQLLRREREGTFPRRFYLGENRAAWLEHEIDEWVLARAALRDAGPDGKR